MLSLNDLSFHISMMEEALLLAHQAFRLGEVPIGAVIVNNNKIIASAYNTKELHNNCLAHAEIKSLYEAQNKLGKWRLSDCYLYSTLEPCFMCAAALVHARIAGVIFAAPDAKFGGIISIYNMANDQRLNHNFDYISGIKEYESTKLLKKFFNQIRKVKKKL